MHAFNGIGGGLMMLFWWALIIILLVVIIKWATRSSPQDENQQNHKDPLTILKERYARGEIDKEEFEEKKRHLID